MVCIAECLSGLSMLISFLNRLFICAVKKYLREKALKPHTANTPLQLSARFRHFQVSLVPNIFCLFTPASCVFYGTVIRAKYHIRHQTCHLFQATARTWHHIFLNHGLASSTTQVFFLFHSATTKTKKTRDSRVKIFKPQTSIRCPRNF